MLGLKRDKVSLVPHDDAWESAYRDTENELRAILGGNIIEVRHVGSTSIKGIAAKPILDVAVVIKDVDALKADMEATDYEYRGECGVAGRHLLVRRINGDISTHHIHCYLENNNDYISVVLFCKYLSEHPEYAKQYNDLKIELASKFPDDRVAYGDAKAAFIENIIAMAKSENCA